MFYCEQECAVMCMQCMYKHMKEQKNHNVCSISDALPTIFKLNIENKQEASAKSRKYKGIWLFVKVIRVG